LPKIFKNGSISQSKWLLYKGKKIYQKNCSQSSIRFIPCMLYNYDEVIKSIQEKVHYRLSVSNPNSRVAFLQSLNLYN